MRKCKTGTASTKELPRVKLVTIVKKREKSTQEIPKQFTDAQNSDLTGAKEHNIFSSELYNLTKKKEK